MRVAGELQTQFDDWVHKLQAVEKNFRTPARMADLLYLKGSIGKLYGLSESDGPATLPDFVLYDRNTSAGVAFGASPYGFLRRKLEDNVINPVWWWYGADVGTFFAHVVTLGKLFPYHDEVCASKVDFRVARLVRIKTRARLRLII